MSTKFDKTEKHIGRIFVQDMVNSKHLLKQ